MEKNYIGREGKLVKNHIIEGKGKTISRGKLSTSLNTAKRSGKMRMANFPLGV